MSFYSHSALQSILMQSAKFFFCLDSANIVPGGVYEPGHAGDPFTSSNQASDYK